MARTTALRYKWWSMLIRLASPDQHAEGLTCRPLMLNALGKQTQHGEQTRLTISGTHVQPCPLKRPFGVSLSSSKYALQLRHSQTRDNAGAEF